VTDTGWRFTLGKESSLPALGRRHMADENVKIQSTLEAHELQEVDHCWSMRSSLGRALAQVKTNVQWSMLPSIVAKVNARLDPAEHTTARGLAIFLSRVEDAELARNGVWVHWFDPKHMPIVLTNPAFARVCRAELGDSQPKVLFTADSGARACTCGAIQPANSDYFTSTDYNAGRHSMEKSSHRINCIAWTPPTTGHLHSWRRSFEG